jgi:anti-anti-sigma factor
MAYSLSVEGKNLCVLLSESVDLSVTNTLKEEFEQVMSSDITVVRIDASALSYIDSSGVASLLFMRKLCTRFNANFSFDVVSQAAARVISLANLDSVLGLPKVSANTPVAQVQHATTSNAQLTAPPEFSDADAMAIFQNDVPLPKESKGEPSSFEIKPGSFS